MLQKIKITNFKSFDDIFEFDLSQTKGFNFNEESIRDNIVNKAIIYGYNGTGKTNLGLAIFDIVSHTTDKRFVPNKYKNYLNANCSSKIATFEFKFKFDDNILKYRYTKSSYDKVLDEYIEIDGKEFVSIQRQDLKEDFILKTDAKGTETLKKNLKNSYLSIVKYINSNTILESNDVNNCFNKFVEFINSMLYFRNLDDRFYIGYDESTYRITDDIVRHGNLLDFENFLNEAGVECKLKEDYDGEFYNIHFSFDNKNIPLLDIASSGTVSLTLFYFWYQRLKVDNNLKFLFLDEFDAFYHHSLSRLIIKKLQEIYDIQVILTTHNTSLLSNELLRPDCYFMMYKNKIKSLSNSTHKELREAHNIEKMYRAGAFE